MEIENRWILDADTKNKYTPIIKDFIDNLENKKKTKNLLTKDFSDTKLNPSKLGLILEELGYNTVAHDDNGWELDFWITYKKEGYKPLMISGCGMTFELILSEVD